MVINKSDNSCKVLDFTDYVQGLDNIEAKGMLLARDVILDLLNENQSLTANDSVSVCLRTCVKKMLIKHEILFSSWMRHLDIGTNRNAQETFSFVVNQLLLEGITWGRIIAAFAFMGCIATHCRAEDRPLLTRKLALCLILRKDIIQYVKNCGGWEKLCEEFPVPEDINGFIWRSLFVTGLGLLTAMLALHLSVT